MAEGQRSSSAWIGGVATILIGIGFMWRNQGPAPQIDPSKWWAWLMFLPAIMMLSVAWRHWKGSRRIGGALLAGLMTMWLATVFLLGIPFASSWPLMFVFMGVYLILRSFAR